MTHQRRVALILGWAAAGLVLLGAWAFNVGGWWVGSMAALTGTAVAYTAIRWPFVE